MSNIRIVTDSSCDLPPEIISEHNITVVPLTIRIAGEEFVDQLELSTSDFWTRSRSSAELPQTAAPAPGAFLDAFAKAVDDGCESVICITISGELSATYQSAVTATDQFDLDLKIEVIDSRLVTIGLGMVVLFAARQSVNHGFDEVVSKTQEFMAGISAFGTLDSLENLRKGGRIGTAQALLGSVLSIKPVVQIVDGKVEAESKQRTRSKALHHLVEKCASIAGVQQVAISHAQARDIEDFVELVKDRFGEVELLISPMGPVLGTHVGEGAIALVVGT